MKRGSISTFELHVEKIVLGLTGLFALVMLWMYLIRSPNTVPYERRAVTPGELDQAILQSARRLDEALRRAQPEEYPTTEYARQLKRQFDAGILGGGTPAEGPVLAADLPLTGVFGEPIEVPGLDGPENTGHVKGVAPVRPH